MSSHGFIFNGVQVFINRHVPNVSLDVCHCVIGVALFDWSNKTEWCLTGPWVVTYLSFLTLVQCPVKNAKNLTNFVALYRAFHSVIMMIFIQKGTEDQLQQDDNISHCNKAGFWCES